MSTFAEYTDTNVDGKVLKKLETQSYVYRNGIHVKWSVSQCDVGNIHYVTLTGLTNDVPDDKENWVPVVDKNKNIYWRTQASLKWLARKNSDLAFMSYMDLYFNDCYKDANQNTDYIDMIGQLTSATFHAVCEEKFEVSCGIHLGDIQEFLWNWGYDDSYATAKMVADKIGNAIQDYLWSDSIHEKLLAIIDHNCKPYKKPRISDFNHWAMTRKDIHDSNIVGLVGWTKKRVEKMALSVGCDAWSCVDDIIYDIKKLFSSVGVQFDIQLIIANACEESGLHIENPILDKNDNVLSPFSKDDYITLYGAENAENIKFAKIHSVLDNEVEITVNCKVNTDTREVFNITSSDALEVENSHYMYLTVEGEKDNFPVNEKYKAECDEYWYVSEKK